MDNTLDKVVEIVVDKLGVEGSKVTHEAKFIDEHRPIFLFEKVYLILFCFINFKVPSEPSLT